VKSTGWNPSTHILRLSAYNGNTRDYSNSSHRKSTHTRPLLNPQHSLARAVRSPNILITPDITPCKTQIRFSAKLLAGRKHNPSWFRIFCVLSHATAVSGVADLFVVEGTASTRLYVRWGCHHGYYRCRNLPIPINTSIYPSSLICPLPIYCGSNPTNLCLCPLAPWLKQAESQVSGAVYNLSVDLRPTLTA
jgi:hypothetical protein